MTQLVVKRIDWVDYAKFIGIFFVVLGLKDGINVNNLYYNKLIYLIDSPHQPT